MIIAWIVLVLVKAYYLLEGRFGSKWQVSIYHSGTTMAAAPAEIIVVVVQCRRLAVARGATTSMCG